MRTSTMWGRNNPSFSHLHMHPSGHHFFLICTSAYLHPARAGHIICPHPPIRISAHAHIIFSSSAHPHLCTSFPPSAYPHVCTSAHNFHIRTLARPHIIFSIIFIPHVRDISAHLHIIPSISRRIWNLYYACIKNIPYTDLNFGINCKIYCIFKNNYNRLLYR